MFSWQVDGNGGQTRQSGGRVEGYRRYHHGHSTDIADLLVIGAAEYAMVLSMVLFKRNIMFDEALSV